MSTPQPPLPPSVGRYKVTRRLGAGAMGEVYEGEDPQLGRKVAIKLLSEQMAVSPEFRERFRREAVAMAQVTHPHVVQVYELGSHEGIYYFSMELVDGGDCATLLERGTVSSAHAARLIYQAALGLAAAARQGLVHRDVKPANLLIHQGSVKVSDFGIARAVEASGGLTQMGIVLGTPEYMAPEQAMGLPVDLRADIYALGITLFHLATHTLPFTGDPRDILQKQVDIPVPDARSAKADIPEALASLIRRMTEKDPKKRIQTYEEIAAELAVIAGVDATVATAGTPGAILFTDGPMSGRKIDLPEGEFVIGRQPDCNLVIDDQQASRRHGLFLRDSQGVSVRDLGSRNGVLVNGVRVTSQRVRVGDLVQVGSTTFKVAPGNPLSLSQSGSDRGTQLLEGRLSFICQLSRAASRGGSTDAVLRVLGSILSTTPELLPINRVALLRAGDGQLQRPVLHVCRAETDKVQPLVAAIQTALQSSQVFWLRDAHADPRFAATAGAVSAILCAPLLVGGRVVGALYADCIEARAFSPSELTFFETVANIAAAGVGQVEGKPSK